MPSVRLEHDDPGVQTLRRDELAARAHDEGERTVAKKKSREQNVYYLPSKTSRAPIPEDELEAYAATVAELIAETRTATGLGEGASFIPEFIAQATASGWKQERMAEALGVSQTTIWRYTPLQPKKARRTRRPPRLCARARELATRVSERKGQTNFPADVRAEAVGLAKEYTNAGLPVRRLARDVGLNPSTLLNWCSAAGEEGRDNRPRPRSQDVPRARRTRPGMKTPAPPSLSSMTARCVISYRGATVETPDASVAAKLLRELLED